MEKNGEIVIFFLFCWMLYFYLSWLWKWNSLIFFSSFFCICWCVVQVIFILLSLRCDFRTVPFNSVYIYIIIIIIILHNGHGMCTCCLAEIFGIYLLFYGHHRHHRGHWEQRKEVLRGKFTSIQLKNKQTNNEYIKRSVWMRKFQVKIVFFFWKYHFLHSSLIFAHSYMHLEAYSWLKTK